MKTKKRIAKISFGIASCVILCLFLFSFNMSQEKKLIGKWKQVSQTFTSSTYHDTSMPWINVYKFLDNNQFLLTQTVIKDIGMGSKGTVTQTEGDYKMANNIITLHGDKIEDVSYTLTFLSDSIMQLSSVNTTSAWKEVYHKIH
jgi:hypothetical protein